MIRVELYSITSALTGRSDGRISHWLKVKGRHGVYAGDGRWISCASPVRAPAPLLPCREMAAIVVQEADERTGRPTKYATLLTTCGDHVRSLYGTLEPPSGHLAGDASFVVGDYSEALRAW
ncbi:MAG: hypothetical protein ACYC0X_17575 [Pirellulaceae bacterium]